jgi:hypothetical protein
MKSRQIFALGGAAALAYAAFEPWRIEVRRFDIHLENLPESAVGTRVLQISDLHAGAIMPLALLRRIIQLAARENADLIALTGDLVSRRGSYSRFSAARYLARPIMEYAASVARELEILRPKLGIYVSPGNHDLWNESFAPIAEVLAQSGITSLLNRSIRLENGLVLAGLDDLRAGNPDVRAALDGVDFRQPQVILNHNPRLALLLANRNALILSGHTHAGQVRLPGVKLSLFPASVSSAKASTDWVWRSFMCRAAPGRCIFRCAFACDPKSRFLR